MAALILGAAAGGWAVWAGLALRTHGVTGSDPYAYAQMAVDLAERGTLQHRFMLAPVAERLNLPVWPTVHVGYLQPRAGRDVSASVWPPGASLLLVPGFLVAGELALYATMPMVAVLCLLPVGFLARRLAEGEEVALQCLCSALAILIVTTSYRQLESAVVPMADLPAQLFTLLAVWLAWAGAARRFPLRYALAAGVAVGLAYLMRYTQVLVLVPIVGLAHLYRQRPQSAPVPGKSPSRVRWRWLAVFGGAALTVAAPDLAYHQAALGSPFRPGGLAELSSFHLASVPAVVRSLAVAFCRTNEYGYLLPFLAVGVVAGWRRCRTRLLYLGSVLGLLVAVQLPYRFLYLRDLLPILPIAALVAAYGMVQVVRWGLTSRRRSVAALVMIVSLLVLRTRITIQLPARSAIDTFGYVTQEERTAIDHLRGELPPGALVGASLNSGAVELYTGRPAFRPALWTAEQREAFVADRLTAGAPVFFLVDGTEMERVLASLPSTWRIVLVDTLPLPFWTEDVSAHSSVRLYQVLGLGQPSHGFLTALAWVVQ